MVFHNFNSAIHMHGTKILLTVCTVMLKFKLQIIKNSDVIEKSEFRFVITASKLWYDYFSTAIKSCRPVLRQRRKIASTPSERAK